LWEALEKLRVTPSTVYRGITRNPATLLAGRHGSAGMALVFKYVVVYGSGLVIFALRQKRWGNYL